MRQLRLRFSAFNSYTWFPIIGIAIKYAAVGVILTFLFQSLGLYLLVHPEHVYLILSLVVLASGAFGSFFIMRSRYLDRKYAADPLAILSKREREVYQMLLTTKSNKEICQALFIEISTLKSHINQIYKKLNVRNRKALSERISS